MEVRPGYKQTEVGVIPENWNVKRLGELGEALIGLTYKPSDVRKHGMLVLRSSNIQNDVLAFDDNVFVDTDIPERIKVRSGDVLVCVRNGSRNLIGKATLLDERTVGMTFGAFMAGLPKSNRKTHQLSVPVRDPKASNQRAPRRHDQPDHQQEPQFLSRPSLPASTDEQRAIATALSDVDALLGGLERLIAKKRDLKQAAMQQLLTGKTRLAGFSGEWETKRLSEITSIRNQKVLPSNVGIDTPCVELDHIGRGNGRLLECSTAQNSKSSKYRFFSGDVLFGRLRSYLRKFWHADRDGICTTEIWPLMTDSQQVNSGFLHALVQSDRFIEAASISYGTHMPRADWGVMRNFEVRLPRIREQLAIAEILSDMDAEQAALEARREKTRDLKQAMMQELLTGKTRLVAVGGASA